MGKAAPYRRKYCRCHACGAVRPAPDFKRVNTGYRASGHQVRCPVCGHAGPYWSFVATEPPDAAGEGPG